MAKMKLFYSGGEGHSKYPPERILDNPDIMVSYWTCHNKKPSKRIRRIIRNRLKRKEKENEDT